MGSLGPDLSQAPTLSAADASVIARDLYHLDVVAEELSSERDQNYLLTTQAGEKFVLKISNSAESRALLEAQNDAMTYLASRVSFCPRLILSVAGQALAETYTEQSRYDVRLVTYIPGCLLAHVKQTPPLLFDLGRRLGQFSRAMADFDHPALHREFHWDLAKGVQVINDYRKLLTDKDLLAQLERCYTIFESALSAQQTARLPLKIIHGDANDHNLLVQDEQVVGLIDFGDMIHSYAVGELAIALAYAVLDKQDPLTSAQVVVAGYRTEFKLSRNEIGVLWPLMLLRLCMSVCLAAHQRRQKPANEYLDVSQQAIQRSFPRLLSIDPGFAEHAFLSANYAAEWDEQNPASK